MLDELRTALAGRYVVERELGEGGMALVYLARDLRHSRGVALKVLRPEVSAAIGAKRFLEEIRLTAKLQHVHILPLYDSGAVGDLLYYVMPYMEDASLRGMLNRERHLSIVESVRLTSQVASALDYAHHRGVLHRDIKPENILIQGGQALLADFGIALELHRAGGTRFTQAGVTVGTPQYMSPEQAAGDRNLDARSDIYSLAAVMYEMLAGEPPFTGPTIQSILHRLVTETPRPLRQLRDKVPAALEGVLDRALAKLPADRFKDAAEFAEALARVPLYPTSPESETVPIPVPKPKSAPFVWPVAIAGAMTMGAIVWRLIYPPGPEPIDVRFAVPTQSQQVDAEFAWAPTMAVGPTGRDIVFRDGALLQVRALDEFTPRPLAGTEGAMMPAFSPDGKWLAFEQNGHLRKVALAGGAVIDIAPADVGPGMTWGEDDKIYFSSLGGRGGIWRVPVAGGMPQPVTQVSDTGRSAENAHAWPQLLPGGKQLLFTVLGATGGAEDSRVVVETIGSRARKTLVEGRTFGRYVNTDQLLSVTDDGSVYAMSFKPGGGVGGAKDQQVLADVHVASSNGAAVLAVAKAGTLAYEPSISTAPLIVRIVDRTGGTLATIEPSGYLDEMRIGPDGRHIAANIRVPSSADVWLYGPGEVPERLTLDIAEDEYPVWSPDGSQIAYTTSQSSQAKKVMLKDLVGGKPERIRTWPRHLRLTSWSADGKWLLGEDFGPSQGQDVWALAVEEDEQILLAGGPNRQSKPAFSPDGKWVAYQSDESGRLEIWIVSFPDPSVRRPITTSGGRAPRWDPLGGGLCYLQRDTLRSVGVSAAGRPTGSGQMLFQTDARMFDVTPDGKRFYLLVPNPAFVAPGIRVVTGWARDLKRGKAALTE